jgi:hypothetical protein
MMPRSAMAVLYMQQDIPRPTVKLPSGNPSNVELRTLADYAIYLRIGGKLIGFHAIMLVS